MKVDVKKIIGLLKKEYPESKIALHYKTPLDLLVATILSAQCTDVRVNQVTAALFKKYRSAKDYALADKSQFEDEIKSTGFFRNKAKSIIACAKVLVGEKKGKVPGSLSELVKLPGIGRKTANVILGSAFNVPGIVVDTHVKRLSYRLGLTKNTDPVKIEFDLMAIVPKHDWIHFSNALIFHGRKVCLARGPRCAECLLESICPKKGI